MFGAKYEFSGGSRGGSGVQTNEPPLEPELFHFHGEFQEKNGQTAQTEPPSANLNPRSKNPGSVPDESVQFRNCPAQSGNSNSVRQFRNCAGQF